MVAVRALSGAEAERLTGPLAEILLDCVEGGASVSFMAPLSRGKAEAYWRRVAAEVAAGERVLLVAEDGSRLLGTAQLVLAQPENQPHRADVSKVLVPRAARQRGIGAALMAAIDAEARKAGKSVLVLDTASREAERLYERSGWRRVGTIPNYALLPDGELCDTVYFHKQLSLQVKDGA
jgi:GNAT superfamily N-acetyltransferase